MNPIGFASLSGRCKLGLWVLTLMTVFGWWSWRPSQAVATSVAEVVDLAPDVTGLEKWRQEEYHKLRQSGNATADSFKGVDEEFLRRARSMESKRTGALGELTQRSGIQVKQGAGGTDPSVGRGITGDIDTDSLSPKDYERLKKTAEKMGYKVKAQGDSFTIKELNVTAHRKPTDYHSQTGSSAHSTETGRGFNKETALGHQANDPSISVSDNLKKGAHTLDKFPDRLSGADLQEMGKMTGRNLDAAESMAGRSAQSPPSVDQGFRSQCDMLKKGYSPEAAGVVRPNATYEERAKDLADFQRKAREANMSSAKASEQWAQNRSGELTQRAQQAESNLQAAKASGDPNNVKQARANVQAAKEELINFQTNRAAAREAAVRNSTSAGKMLAEAGGINTAGKSPSQIQEALTRSERSSLARTVNPEVSPAGGAKMPAGAAAEAGLGSRLMKGLKGALGVLGIIHGVKEGARQAGEEAANGKDSTLTSAVKTIGYTAWHGLGFGGAQDAGKRAGEASRKQYEEDVKSGKVDPNSKASSAWSHLRGVGWGLADFTGLQSIKDALTEGGGWLKDRYGQYKNEKALTEQQKALAERGDRVPKDMTSQLAKADSSKSKDDRTGAAEKDKTDPSTRGKDPGEGSREKDVRDKKEPKDAKTANDGRETGKDGDSTTRDPKGLSSKDAPTGSRTTSKEGEQNPEDRDADRTGERRDGVRKVRPPRDPAGRDGLRDGRPPGDPESRGPAKMAKAQNPRPQQSREPQPAPEQDGGTHQEEAGWLKDKNGMTKLTYTKDRAGNILSKTYSHYDSQGRLIGKETENASGSDAGSSGSARGAGFDGSYAGQFGGGSGGSISMTIKGGSVSGRLSGSYQGGAVNGSFSGSVDGSGNIRTSLQGSVKGTARSYPFSGTISGRVTGGGASGSWSARNQYGTPTGTWQASRR